MSDNAFGRFESLESRRLFSGCSGSVETLPALPLPSLLGQEIVSVEPADGRDSAASQDQDDSAGARSDFMTLGWKYDFDFKTTLSSGEIVSITVVDEVDDALSTFGDTPIEDNVIGYATM
jgi:hypothetical protein